MAENGYGPVSGHMGRIPNYGKTQVNPMGSIEPPACIQNAMMTKDKKPFTYTPGGLDLSQIKTPSMARRLARQRSLEEQEQAAYNAQHPANGGAHHPGGGPVPPPPPPPQAPAPPPPPPLVIQAPNSKSPKPVPLGERPEIVIPENPIGMLRKTNSPYHWEAEKADIQRMGPVPKFVEKVPSPLTVKMPPSSFSQQPPQTYTPHGLNNNIRQNNAYANRTPESPVHKPEPLYAHQKSASPGGNASTPTRDFLQRQDSQFNKSPMPFGNQSPLVSNGAPFSPAPNSSWKQPEKIDSPKSLTPPSNKMNRAPFSPQNTQQYSPNYQPPTGNTAPVYHTLPRQGPRIQENNVNNAGFQRDNNNNNAIYNNINSGQRPQTPTNTPWRNNNVNRYAGAPDNYSVNQNQEEPYHPPWNTTQNQPYQQHVPAWNSQGQNNNTQQASYSPPWRQNQDQNANRPGTVPNQEQPQYQSHMSIPVTPRKPKQEPEYIQPSQPQNREAVYVTQEPVYYCDNTNPNSVPAWVKTQKEKTKTPPPVWCNKPLEGRKSLPRELVTPPRDTPAEPEWVRKSNEMQRNIRDVISPPKYQQPVQPNWSTRPSENRKSVPRDNEPLNQGGIRMIPVQMQGTNEQNRHGGNHPPHLRVVIDMQNPNGPVQANAPYSQPTQRIMRVLSPQLVRLDDGPPQNELPTLNRSFQGDNLSHNQPKTRIIPIQLEGGGNEGPNKRVYYHKFTQEGPPRQSKAFKVLQIITGTEDSETDNKFVNSKVMNNMENQHGYSDL